MMDQIMGWKCKTWEWGPKVACLGGAVGSVAVCAAWLWWSASLGLRPSLARSLCQIIVAYALRLNSRAGTEGSTVSSLICDRWLILGLETLSISRCLNHCESESLDIFWHRLKTELFEHSYNWHHACQTTLLLCDSLSLSRSFLLWPQPWSLSTIMLLWHSFLIIIIIMACYKLYLIDWLIEIGWLLIAAILHTEVSK